MNEELIELYFAIIEAIYDHVELVVCAFGFYLLCKDFFTKRKHAVMIGIIWLGTMLFQYYIPVYMGDRVASAISCLTSFVYMLFVTCRRKEVGSFWKKGAFSMEQAPVCFYLAVTFFFLKRLGNDGIALELFLVVADKIQNTLTLKLDHTLPGAWAPYFVTECLCLLFFLAMTVILMIFFTKLINRAFYDKDGRYSWKEIGILLIPSAAGIILLLLRRSYDSLIEEKTGFNAYRLSYTIGILLSLNYLVLLFTNLIELYLYQNLRKKQEEEKQKSLLHNQMKDMQVHIAEVERIYTGIKGVRHDLNNHIHVIGSLLEQKQYPEAQQYLENLQNTIEMFDFPIKTGNPITDVIVNGKYREAAQKGIGFRSDFCFVQDGNINAFDISIILNNTLENAFAAAEKSEARSVSLHTERKKNAWFLIIVNSYDGTLRPGKDGLPMSDKEETGMHGLGLKNIKAVVEKYYGIFTIEQDEKEVTVTIMLMLN